MNIYDIAIARALTSGGGGGGSSDFSTATVTLVDNGGLSALLYGAFYYESEPPFFPDPHTNAFVNTDQETVEIVLYKGLALIDASNVIDQGATFTVSGNASVPTPLPVINVTGDCTITVVDDDGGGGGQIDA